MTKVNLSRAFSEKTGWNKRLNDPLVHGLMLQVTDLPAELMNAWRSTVQDK